MSALGLIVISTQLLAMAGFDPTTASFILAEGGAGNVGIALLMNLLPSLPPVAAAYMTSFLVRTRGRRPLSYSTLFITSLLWGLCLYVAPWWFTVLAFLLAVYAGRATRQEGDGNPSTHDRVVLRIFLSTAGFVVAALLTSVPSALPTENLTPSDKKAFAGAVLAEDDLELVVLRLDDRQVVRIAKQGTTRVPCRAVDPIGLPGGDRSLMSLRRQAPRYPGCLRSSK